MEPAGARSEANLAERLAEVKRKKEAAKRDYEANVRKLHQAERLENRANIQLHATDHLLKACQHKKQMDGFKEADRALLRQRKCDDAEYKAKHRMEEQVRKEQARQQRRQWQLDKMNTCTDEKMRTNQEWAGAVYERECIRQEHHDQASNHRLTHYSNKEKAVHGLAQNLHNIIQERRQQNQETVREYSARSKAEAARIKAIKQERAGKVAIAKQKLRAETRAKVANDMLYDAHCDELEAAELAAEMERLKLVEMKAKEKLEVSQQKLEAFNSTLATLKIKRPAKTPKRQTVVVHELYAKYTVPV